MRPVQKERFAPKLCLGKGYEYYLCHCIHSLSVKEELANCTLSGQAVAGGDVPPTEGMVEEEEAIRESKCEPGRRWWRPVSNAA